MDNQSKVLEKLQKGRQELIEDHQKVVEQHKKELEEIDRIIERVKSGPPFQNMKRMSLAESIQHVLMVDGPMHVERLTEILKTGGVKMGERYISNIKGTISNNVKTGRFTYNKRTGIVRLREETV